MRERARVLLIGEVTGVGRSKVQAYFELRDGEGAVPCAIWLNDLEKAGLPEGALRDGAEVVIAGGPDYYPGGGQASPSFCLPRHPRAAGRRGRPAGPARGAAQAAAGRGPVRAAEAAGAAAAAEDDRRRHGGVAARPGATCWPGWSGAAGRGTVVWAFAPVQDRHAAPAIAAAIQDLAARPEVEAIVVTRGGGSLADLWAFCDETLCRTVAMLRVPVISAVGHERDSTLIDDVAAVACSTPTHAAEAAVPLDCGAARRELERCVAVAAAGGGGRGRRPRAATWPPWPAARRGRCGASAAALNQKTREIRAASERGLAERGGFQRRIADGRAGAARAARARGRRRKCERAPRAALQPAPTVGACAPTIPSAPWSAATPWPRPPTGEPVTSAAPRAPPSALDCASPTARVGRQDRGEPSEREA